MSGKRFSRGRRRARDRKLQFDVPHGPVRGQRMASLITVRLMALGEAATAGTSHMSSVGIELISSSSRSQHYLRYEPTRRCSRCLTSVGEMAAAAYGASPPTPDRQPGRASGCCHSTSSRFSAGAAMASTIRTPGRTDTVARRPTSRWRLLRTATPWILSKSVASPAEQRQRLKLPYPPGSRS